MWRHFDNLWFIEMKPWPDTALIDHVDVYRIWALAWFHYGIRFRQFVVDRHETLRRHSFNMWFLELKLNSFTASSIIEDNSQFEEKDDWWIDMKLCWGWIFTWQLAKTGNILAIFPLIHYDNILYYHPYFLNWILNFRHFSKCSRINNF